MGLGIMGRHLKLMSENLRQSCGDLIIGNILIIYIDRYCLMYFRKKHKMILMTLL